MFSAKRNYQQQNYWASLGSLCEFSNQLYASNSSFDILDLYELFPLSFSWRGCKFKQVIWEQKIVSFTIIARLRVNFNSGNLSAYYYIWRKHRLLGFCCLLWTQKLQRKYSGQQHGGLKKNTTQTYQPFIRDRCSTYRDYKLDFSSFFSLRTQHPASPFLIQKLTATTFAFVVMSSTVISLFIELHLRVDSKAENIPTVEFTGSGGRLRTGKVPNLGRCLVMSLYRIWMEFYPLGGIPHSPRRIWYNSQHVYFQTTVISAQHEFVVKFQQYLLQTYQYLINPPKNKSIAHFLSRHL